MVLGHLDVSLSTRYSFRLLSPRILTGGLSIAVAHTNAPDIGECISQRIKKDFQLESVLVMNASLILGAHAGPGAYSIAIHNHSFAISDDTLND